MRFITRYSISLAAVVPAVALRWLLDPVLGRDIPLSPLYASVAFAVWFGGWRAAVPASILGGLVAEYLFIEPRGSLQINEARGIVAIIVYAVTCTVIIGLGSALRRAQRQSARAAEDARNSAARWRASRERLNVALEAGRMGDWELDPATGRARTSFRHDQCFGAIEPFESWSYDAFLSYVHPEDQAEVQRRLDEAVATRGEWHFDCRVVWPDGSIHWIAAHGRHHLDPATGEPRHLLGVVHDITERKRAEEELRRAKEVAETASKAKDHFLAVLSHELRTPLTPVLALAHALEADPALPPAAREDAATICRNVLTEARLIDDLLDMTRIPRGKVSLHFEVVDAHKALRAVMDVCRIDAQEKRLEVTLDLRAEPHAVWADPGRLQQILLNIIENAVKFTPPGGRIAIRTTAASERLRVEVSDTGVGIPPDRLPHIFDAFEQGERTVTRQFGGLGLGLAIVKSLVEMHGGAISATSAGPGEGAMFRLELNLAPTAATQPARPAAPKLVPRARTCRILLVEDHPDTLRVMSRLLQSFGHTVYTASSVAEALQAADRQEFDVLLSDIGLPDGSGLDVMRELKGRKDLRGVALSGFGLDEDIRLSLQAGFLEHVIKPVNLQVLEGVLRRIGC